MDNFASLVTQYPSAFCFCDTTAPLQSPLWVFTKSAATMTNVSNWSTIFTISNVLKVNSPPICVISIYSPFHLYEGCRQVYLPTPILTTTPTPTTTLTPTTTPTPHTHTLLSDALTNCHQRRLLEIQKCHQRTDILHG